MSTTLRYSPLPGQPDYALLPVQHATVQGWPAIVDEQMLNCSIAGRAGGCCKGGVRCSSEGRAGRLRGSSRGCQCAGACDTSDDTAAR